LPGTGTAAAACTFFERAIAETGVTPERVVTDKAVCYPPALRALLPTAEHRCSKYLNNGLERDHGHLKQRVRPMRGFKRLASADVFARGHALIQNLRHRYSFLTTSVARPLRLAAAWPQLTRVIRVRADASSCDLTLGVTPSCGLPSSLQ
jgi:transposase-like protein